MRQNKVNFMTNRAAFFEKVSSGPEVGEDYQEVYECFCDDYEPTLKDAQFFDITSSKSSVTLTIRNIQEGFKPEPHHTFMLLGGYFRGEMFEIVSIAPYSDNQEYLKIIGKGI